MVSVALGRGRDRGSGDRHQGEGDEALRLDHGVGGRVAHRGVHQDGHRLREGEQGHDGHVQLRARRPRSRTQIQGGAPADVFASADGANMQKLVTGGQVTAEPIDFASNLLTIVVKPGNPKNVKSLADLANVGIVVVVRRRGAVRQVRRRRRSRQRGVTIPPDKITRGPDVKATLTAVSTGDADAGDRVRHRRQGSGQDGAGGQDPRVAERDRGVPDRADRGDAERGARQRVGQLRHVAGGSEDPAERSDSCLLRPSSEPARAGSAARRGRSSPLVAVAFFVLPLVGLLQRAPWGDLWDDLTEPAGARRDPPLARVLALGDRACRVVFGVPLAWRARPRALPRPVARARARRAADGAAAGGRRRRAALRVPAQRRSASASGSTTGSGCSSRSARAGAVLAETFVAMPFLVITVEAGLRSDGPALRGRGREPRRRPLDGVPPGDAAADRAVARTPAPRWRGRARSGSSAPRSRSPATSRAGRRPCRSRCTCSSRRDQDVAIALSLVLLAVSIVVLVVLRDHWFGGAA